MENAHMECAKKHKLSLRGMQVHTSFLQVTVEHMLGYTTSQI